MPPLGSAPSYSTSRTLALALLSILAALLHGALGAADYGVSRPLGTGYLLFAGLLLVYGILLLIRFAEARDAMSDPLPRTAMYVTRHERMNYRAGLGLHGVGMLVALGWALAGHIPVWHLAGALLSLYDAALAQRTRPQEEEAG